VKFFIGIYFDGRKVLSPRFRGVLKRDLGASTASTETRQKFY